MDCDTNPIQHVMTDKHQLLKEEQDKKADMSAPPPNKDMFKWVGSALLYAFTSTIIVTVNKSVLSIYKWVQFFVDYIYRQVTSLNPKHVIINLGTWQIFIIIYVPNHMENALYDKLDFWQMNSCFNFKLTN